MIFFICISAFLYGVLPNIVVSCINRREKKRLICIIDNLSKDTSGTIATSLQAILKSHKEFALYIEKLKLLSDLLNDMDRQRDNWTIEDFHIYDHFHPRVWNHIGKQC